jgi:hypothetical protein
VCGKKITHQKQKSKGGNKIQDSPIRVFQSDPRAPMIERAAVDFGFAVH